MTFDKHVSSIAIGAALISSGAFAQQSLPTIEVGGAPLRATSRPAPAAENAPSRAPAPRAASRQSPGQPAQPAAGVAQAGPAVSPVVVKYAVPSATYTLDAKELQNTRAFDLVNNLLRQAPGVDVTDVNGNPLQPQVNFRGFAASPVAGTPQGLAVYQNGIRINEAWGDNVYWDMIPNIAIDRSTIVTGNPLFGLNAIGGAVVLDMKNGFTYQGFEIDGRGGSFSRRQGAMQYGVQKGDFAAYLALEALGDKGYRQFSGTNIKRLYGDIGWRNAEGLEVHANVTLAGNKSGASGPAPVNLAAIDESAVYTTPQTLKNTLSMFDLNGVYTPTPSWKLFGDVHYRAFDQARVDGNTTEFECEPGEPVCENDNGDETTIPNYFDGQAPLGAIDRTWTRSRTVGGTVQVTNDDRYFGFHNKITVGASIDKGWSGFQANQELGIIQPNLVVGGIGHITEEQASGIASVNVRASNTYLGVYALDTLDVTDRLKVTAGARFNRAGIALYDLRGSALNGADVYTRINPVAGATYEVLPNTFAYGSYSEANRAPTPLELGCADPARPCLIDTFLVADPPLKQVESNTTEFGLRGNVEMPTIFPNAGGYLPGQLTWSAGVYRTNSFNDILAVPSTINGRGYFTNAGSTRREGVEVSLRYTDERLQAYANYTMVNATFRSTFALGAPDNPLAQLYGTGYIVVTPGANLSSVAPHRFKAGADYAVTPQWRVGADFHYAAGGFLFGDEINIGGRLPSYGVLNLRTSYQITPNIQVYGLLENVTNTRTRSFGSWFDTGDISFLTFNNPRMVSLGPPIGAFGGIKVTY
ncbi:TonB-dependent receptor domain-containing protein [Methylocystis parvus]|uniref:TonB-dependent receptor n=1 Tax=Methylocystis parvus TaxID=134 RepID=UPI003C72F3D2